MKRFLMTAVCTLVAVSLLGCGKGDEPNVNPAGDPSITQAPSGQESGNEAVITPSAGADTDDEGTQTVPQGGSSETGISETGLSEIAQSGSFYLLIGDKTYTYAYSDPSLTLLEWFDTADNSDDWSYVMNDAVGISPDVTGWAIPFRYLGMTLADIIEDGGYIYADEMTVEEPEEFTFSPKRVFEDVTGDGWEWSDEAENLVYFGRYPDSYAYYKVDRFDAGSVKISSGKIQVHVSYLFLGDENGNRRNIDSDITLKLAKDYRIVTVVANSEMEYETEVSADEMLEELDDPESVMYSMMQLYRNADDEIFYIYYIVR